MAQFRTMTNNEIRAAILDVWQTYERMRRSGISTWEVEETYQSYKMMFRFIQPRLPGM